MPRYEFEGRIPQIGEGTYIAPSAQVIGDVQIGAQCYIGHGAILRGDYGSIRIGRATAIEEGVIIHARPEDVTVIGDRVTVGHGAMIHNATIEDSATIGMRATVSDFSTVGQGAIVGEAALVRQHQVIPPRSIAVGLPARVVGEVGPQHHDMAVWAKDLYIDLARRYPTGLRELPEPTPTAPRSVEPRSAEPRSVEPRSFEHRAIGVIRTPWTDAVGTPIQGHGLDTQGQVVLDPAMSAGLQDLDGFSHLVLLYAFHQCQGYKLVVTPYMDDRPHGLFATRAPRRPNGIGLTIVALERVEDHTLHVRGVDMLDGTPLLDIKPYVPGFDEHPDARVGWLEDRAQDSTGTRADDRFHGGD